MDNPLFKAIGRERRLREEAYLGTPQFICGIPLKQITPRLLAVLFRINTPFLQGGDATEEDIALFLWATHLRNPMREETPRWLGKTERQKFAKLFRKGFDYDEAERAIDEFMVDTFLDAPDGKPSRPYVCSIAWLEYGMAAKPFNWQREYTLDQPLRIIYQLLRCRAMDNGAVLKNPLSDPIIQGALEELNTPDAIRERSEQWRKQHTGADGYAI